MLLSQNGPVLKRGGYKFGCLSSLDSYLPVTYTFLMQSHQDAICLIVVEAQDPNQSLMEDLKVPPDSEEKSILYVFLREKKQEVGHLKC